MGCRKLDILDKNQHGLKVVHKASAVKLKRCADAWRWEYYIKDHLGNIRISFSDLNDDGEITVALDETNEILEENHYYPFGLKQNGPWLKRKDQGFKNKYNYNGNEILPFSNFMDFGFRTYDGAIGRFLQIDLLADWAPDWTSYRFGFNNPISYADPWGLFETKKEARRYRRSQKDKALRRGKIKKNNEGRYDIRFKGSDGFVTETKSGELDFGSVARHGNAIRQHEPSGWEDFRDMNIATDIVYNILNDGWLLTQRFNPFDVQTTHLAGNFANKNEYQMALVNTTATLIPAGRAVKGIKAVDPVGKAVLKRLNAAQFSKRFKGTGIPRLAPKTRGRINRVLNRGVDNVNHRVGSGSILFQGTKSAGNSGDEDE